MSRLPSEASDAESLISGLAELLGVNDTLVGLNLGAILQLTVHDRPGTTGDSRTLLRDIATSIRLDTYLTSLATFCTGPSTLPSRYLLWQPDARLLYRPDCRPP